MMYVSHSCAFFQPQFTCNLVGFKYTHIHANKQPTQQYAIASAVSGVPLHLSYAMRCSLA